MTSFAISLALLLVLPAGTQQPSTPKQLSNAQSTPAKVASSCQQPTTKPGTPPPQRQPGATPKPAPSQPGAPPQSQPPSTAPAKPAGHGKAQPGSSSNNRTPPKQPSTPAGQGNAQPPAGNPAKTQAAPASGTSGAQTNGKPADELAWQQSATPPTPLVAAPDPVVPGEEVVFTWTPGAERVVATGGGFGEHRDVTHLPQSDDTVWKTTRYVFDLWYPPSAGGQDDRPTGHQRHSVLVMTLPDAHAAAATYHDPRGWRISVLSGWNRYDTPEADPADYTLDYFEPTEDAAERVDVAILPIDRTMTDCGALLRKAVMDAPTQYDALKDLEVWPTWHDGLPAAFGMFHGLDHALPGIPVTVQVMAFERDGKAYVISGRTRTSLYDRRGKIVRALVESFDTEPLQVYEHIRNQEAREHRAPSNHRAAAPRRS